ncbi:1,4-dihydroxy-2-naphthoate prenyltransferase [Leifsonia xyli subsp. xyli]|uniref:1,4-dihydroxy-2-naphthoate octaprenyltransferase n=2 Tax=Leifsonia xyli subsp. xyli TaxID=59736 RepID=Q6AFX1_LEIXX|nr:UbiA family prenyltransferase [Leifsonia xyli]AAT88724.1 1,4-dihydroxy-2-naphthoate octaprenyltransferase [Leifsonia xyli subsp. xyli str. CTCB07]ODA91075.1 1,4-dihydroxy-2-naphthoate prenyltransferase [Leifsonia xyli subsp. xyli]
MPARSAPLSLLLSSHPGPSLVVTVVATGLGLALGYPPGRLALLALAVLLGQLSIGWSNDWMDAAREREVARRDKPAARGDIPIPVVRTAAFAALALALATTALLGPGALLVHTIAIAGGWSYNAGLKRSAISFLPFAVSFGLLPAIAALGRAAPVWPASWVIAAGALLGVAAHLTNVLPDLADDARTGIRGFAHRIGPLVSGVIAFVCLIAATALIALGPGLPVPPLLIAGLALGLAAAVAGIVLLLRRSPTRLLMQLIMTCAVVDAGMLVLAGQSVVA